MDKQQAEKRLRKYLERTADDFKRMVEAFRDMPEPKCNKCGRVIYCGANTLCKEPDCGLKNDQTI